MSSVFGIWPLCFVSEITPDADEGVMDRCTNYNPQSFAAVMKFTLWSQGKNERRTCCIHFISVSIQDQNILFQISIPLGATQHQKIPQIRGFQASNSLPAEQVSRWYRFSEEVVHFFFLWFALLSCFADQMDPRHIIPLPLNCCSSMFSFWFFISEKSSPVKQVPGECSQIRKVPLIPATVTI